jgi:N-acetylmuramoyl-L-alanine amidase
MSARGLTRRSLLAGIAGAAAGGLVRPGGALAALAGPARPTLKAKWLGRVSGAGTIVELTSGADLVGVEWQAPATARIGLRVRRPDGSWSGWVPAGGRTHGPDGPSGADRLIGEPVWTGGTTAVQLRSTRTLNGVRLHLVDVSAGAGARAQAVGIGALAAAAALPRATPLLAAGPGQPPIIARRAWARGIAPPRVTPGYGAVQMAFVHHTENPNGYTAGEVPAMLLAIYAFHRYVNGWNDIGYNFVLDLYGRIFEARAGGIDEPVVGAHAGGYNLYSSGVAVLGSFMSTPISPAARSALERLLAWKLSLHGVPAQGSVVVRVNPAGASYSRFPANARVSLPLIAGHRDGDSTDCPGDVLYGELGGIRAGVRRLAPRTARATLALVPAAAPEGQPVPAPSGGGTLTGAVQLLDGTPIGAAPVLVQARAVSRRGELVSEQTVANATTDAQGRWSLPVTALFGLTPSTGRSAGVWLRALCTAPAGIGSVLSAPLHFSLSGTLSPPAAPSPAPPSTPAPGPPQAPQPSSQAARSRGR